MDGITTTKEKADHAESLDGLQERLDTILRCEIVRDNQHRRLWNRHVTSKQFRQDLVQQVGGDAVSFGPTKRHRQLRVHGKKNEQPSTFDC